MFDATQVAAVKEGIPKLDLGRPFDSLTPVPTCVSDYLEFYGFFETLKSIPADYYWGYRHCVIRGEKYRIASHFWRLPQAKGSVLIAHGLFDHVGLFQGLIRYCLSQGYSVVAVDLPGHGMSDGLPAAIESFDDYALVLKSTLQAFEDQMAVPIFGLGQSTGAAMLMNLVFACERGEWTSPFDRLIFMGPLVRPRSWPSARVVYRLFGRFLSSVQRNFSSPNSHDDEFHRFLCDHDPLQARRIPVSWVRALNEWVDNFPSQPKVETPLLVIQGTADRVVDWRFNIPTIQEHFLNAQVNYIEGAKHHLPNEAEPWRNTIFTSVGQFFRQRAVSMADLA